MLNNLKIGTRIYILAGILIFISCIIGILGLLNLNKSNQDLVSGLTSAKISQDSINLARNAQVHFKIQVQEWKNILLRGNDPAAYQKYYAGFTEQEALVQENLRALKKLMKKQGLNTVALEETIKIHAELGVWYREALTSYEPNKPDSYHIVDNLVKGIDRDPTEAIDTIVKQIETHAVDMTAKTESLAAAKYRAVSLNFIIIILVGISIAVLLAFFLTRQIVDPVNELKKELDALADIVKGIQNYQ